MNSRQGPTALYIHLPWCVRRCPYCDFNAHHAPEVLPEAAYVDALLADLDSDIARFGAGPVGTIFIGGGTPSLFAAAEVGRLLEGIDRRAGLDADPEITLEANPGTVEHGRFADYAAAGINRLSLGVQSFDDRALRRLGRIHDADSADRALAEANSAGIESFNIDLMYGLPEQTPAQAETDIARALEWSPDHVSHYELTIEPGTVFDRHPPALPDSDRKADIEDAARARLAAAGFVRYEISAWARKGRECRHNLNYWRFGDYLGIGAGAHGKVTGVSGRIVRTRKPRSPKGFMMTAGTANGRTLETVPENRRIFEFMLNALRLAEGFTVIGFETATGSDFDALRGPLARAEELELVRVEGDRVRPTEHGRRFLNELIGLFMPAGPVGRGETA